MSNLRSAFGMNCVQCGSELIAPTRSEYLSDGHARHMALPEMQPLLRLSCNIYVSRDQIELPQMRYFCPAP
jgi:hypothetical protein